MSTSTISTIDRSDMLGAVLGLPAQFLGSYNASSAQLVGVQEVRLPRTLIVCGMGGSGIGGNLLSTACDPAVPVVSVKGYDLPGWASTGDHVVCVSYSGNTAETLACFAEAKERGIAITVVTSGGKLLEQARAAGYTAVEVPGGMQPRAAVGVLFAALVAVSEHIGVVGDGRAICSAAAAGAQRVIDQNVDVGDCPARTHALALNDSVIVIYGAGETSAVAERWKAQINENSKCPAFSNVYPELDHNEIVGWTRPTCGGARWSLVELQTPSMSDSIKARFSITSDLIGDAVDGRVSLMSEAVRGIEAAFELIAWGDLISVHIALINEVDPSPVERIESLKGRLAGA